MDKENIYNRGMNPKEALPHGWISRKSKKFPNKIYYFNLKTGVSVWNRSECDIIATDRNIPENKSEEYKSDVLNDDVKIKRIIDKLMIRFAQRNNLQSAVVSPDIELDHQSDESSDTNVHIPETLLEPHSSFVEISRSNSSSDQQIDNSESYLDPPSLTEVSEWNFSSDDSLSKCQLVKLTNYKTNSTRNKQKRNASICSLEYNSLSTEVVSSSSSAKKIRLQNISATVQRHSSEGENLSRQISSNTNCVKLPNISGSVSEKQSYCFVIDTNIIIGDLRYIKRLLDMKIKNHSLSHIFIPWFVVQELDNLTKKSPKGSSPYRRAHEGTKFLYHMFKSKHPRFHGQTPGEVKEWANHYSQNNDDHILESCIGLVSKYPECEIVLLTNDINLRTKATICNVINHTCKSFQEYINGNIAKQFCLMEKRVNKKRIKMSPESSPEVLHFDSTPEHSPVHFDSTPEHSPVHFDSTPEHSPVQFEATSEHSPVELLQLKTVSSMISEALKSLKEVLAQFLVVEMNPVFGEQWKRNINLDILSDILATIVEHWKTIFAYQFSEKDKRNFLVLQKKSKYLDKCLQEKEECLLLLTTIEDVFCSIKRRHRGLEVPIGSIQDMRVACIQEFQKKNLMIEKIDKEEVIEKTDNGKVPGKADNKCDIVLMVFQHNWTVINHLCGLVMDYYNIKHTFSYDKPDSLPEEDVVYSLMRKLHPGVQKLKNLMKKAVGSYTNKIKLGKKFYKMFTSALKTFVPSLQVEVDFLDTTHFNGTVLANYIESPANWFLISEGYKQLENFFNKLEEASTEMSK